MTVVSSVFCSQRRQGKSSRQVILIFLDFAKEKVREVREQAYVYEYVLMHGCTHVHIYPYTLYVYKYVYFMVLCPACTDEQEEQAGPKAHDDWCVTLGRQPSRASAPSL